MSSKLQIKTTKCNEAEGGDEPVSPSGQYFNSKCLSICILIAVEFEVPIDDSFPFMEIIQENLPINPRFSSIMVDDAERGVKCWKRVKVNIVDHINVPRFPPNLSLNEYDDNFDEYLTKIAMYPLPQDRPLWEVHIIKYPTTKALGNMVFKISHALGDGYSLMGVLLSCLQRADNPSLPFTFPSLRRVSEVKTTTSLLRSSLSAIYNTTCDFGWSVFKSLVADDKTPIRSGNEAVHAVKISTIALSLDRVKEIKTKLKLSINDVVTGIVFLGARLYMEASGMGFGNSQSTALVLLNTRNVQVYSSVQEMLKTDSEVKWGNQFAFLHVALPELTTNNESFEPLDFVFKAHKIINQKKNSLAVPLSGHSLEMLRKFGGPEVASKYVRSTIKNASLAVSNVIGPDQQMAVANRPCKGMYFTVVGVPSSLIVSILSYMKTLRISLGVEKGFINSQKFDSCLENAFDMIYRAAMEK